MLFNDEFIPPNVAEMLNLQGQFVGCVTAFSINCLTRRDPTLSPEARTELERQANLMIQARRRLVDLLEHQTRLIRLS